VTVKRNGVLTPCIFGYATVKSVSKNKVGRDDILLDMVKFQPVRDGGNPTTMEQASNAAKRSD
jgi:hypothetical protein